MSRIWIARIVLATLTLEVGLIFSLYTGDVPLLRRSEEGLFRTFLSWVSEIDPDKAILDTEEEANGWSLRVLQSGEPAETDWSFVEVPASRELFDEKEPKASEYAILLAKLHQAGARELVLTQALSWPNAAELELRALDGALRPFGEILLPIDLSEVPRPSPTPGWLQGSLLPEDILVGDASALPVMNQVVVPSSVTARQGLRFSFPDFGSRDLQYRAEGRLPLITRWGDRYLPSWSLGLAMAMEGVEPDELIIEPGRHLRIGTNGPVIPLDDFGRAKMSTDLEGGSERELISALSLFPIGEGELPVLQNGVVLLDATTAESAQKSGRLLAEAQHLRGFPRPGKAKLFRRLDLKWEVMLYFEIVLVAIFALYLKPFPQLLAWAVLCAALFFFSLGLLNWRGLWTPVLPLVMAMVFSWCLVGYLQQIAHPVRAKKKVAKAV